MADITMPQLGETVTEGTIVRWFKQAGDAVDVDETLFEVSTDKVDTEVPSPVAGVLSEVLANEGDVVEVGQVLARVGEPGQAAPDAAGTPQKPEQPEPPDPAEAEPEPETEPEPLAAAAEAPGPGREAAGIVLSPIVRRLISDNGLDPAEVTGTGIGGRVTRADVEQAIRARAGARAAETFASTPPGPGPESEDEHGQEAAQAPPRNADPSSPPDRPASASRRAASPRAPAPRPAPTARDGDRAVPLNNIRRRTADHMVMSKQVSPHVLTAVEVDYEAVEQVRRAARSDWKAEEGFSLTYLPFIARAVIDALREYPHLNASFGGDELIIHRSVNLAIAVDIDFQGLLAPVIPGAEGRRLRQIARDVVDLAARTRSRRLRPDDLASGTFTITNAGSYGTMMQFPIINQPQVAILSTDGVSRKPVAVSDGQGNEAVVVHSVGVLALAWDHRAFDGAYAAAFLNRVRQIIETRDWEAEIR